MKLVHGNEGSVDDSPTMARRTSQRNLHHYQGGLGVLHLRETHPSRLDQQWILILYWPLAGLQLVVILHGLEEALM